MRESEERKEGKREEGKRESTTYRGENEDNGAGYFIGFEVPIICVLTVGFISIAVVKCCTAPSRSRFNAAILPSAK